MDSASLYPSYVALDQFIDVGRLCALDEYVRERLERRIASERDRAFYTGPFTLSSEEPTRPGSRMIYLSRSRLPDDYYDLDRAEVWERTEDASEFAELMSFIETLPFQATARMLIMYDPEGRAITAHRDHDSIDLCHEFIWFRTNQNKPFYMLDPESGVKAYVAGHSAWFDTANQFHGGDATGELAWSIRVDGHFANSLRALIPEAPANPASRPAKWAHQLGARSPGEGPRAQLAES
jgi:hypothetical protein